MSIEPTSDPIDAALDELRRAEILVHTRYPDPGPAYPIGMGLLASAYIAAWALPTALMIIAMLSMLIVMGIVLRVYLNRRGVVPDGRQAPEPLRREMVIMAGVYLGIAAACGLLWATTSWWVTAIVGGLAVGIATQIYARRFARAAHAVEIDAGIEPLGVA